MTNTFNFLSSLEQIALGILSGAANNAAPLSAIDPTHPVVSAAVDAGKIGAQIAATSGVPVAQIATLGLGLANVFASMFAPKPTTAPAPAPAQAAA